MSRAVARYRRNNAALPAPPADVFEVAVLGEIELQQTMNTFYYRTDGSSLPDLAESLIANKLVLDLVPVLTAAQSVQFQATKVRVTCLTKPTRTPWEVAPATALFGSIAGTCMPSTDAIVFTRRTSVRSACGRGRIYLPGIPQTNVQNSFVQDGGYFATLDAVVTAILAPNSVLVVGTITPGLYSRGSRTHKTLGFSDLQSASWSRILGTVRRRRIGRGK